MIRALFLAAAIGSTPTAIGSADDGQLVLYVCGASTCPESAEIFRAAVTEVAGRERMAAHFDAAGRFERQTFPAGAGFSVQCRTLGEKVVTCPVSTKALVRAQFARIVRAYDEGYDDEVAADKENR